MKSYKHLFKRALAHIPAHLHAAAHSHHLRPDAVYDAHMQSLKDAYQYADKKWSKVIFRTVYPEAQSHVARILNTGQPDNVTFAPNTHEFVVRLISCFPTSKPIRILTTDSEFYSAARQFTQLEDRAQAFVTRVPVEPFETFPARFAEAADDSYDMIFFSHVFFNSGFIVPDLQDLCVKLAHHPAFIVIDGYHGFMAVPTDLSLLKDRVFYIAGGYKYAMSGEGSCFLHAPAGYGAPATMGWFGDYETNRFAGSTFDTAGLYRFNAVMNMLTQENITVEESAERVASLQAIFMDLLPDHWPPLVPCPTRGRFLTFQTDDAEEIYERLQAQGLITDFRHNRLRFGFGIYHDVDDIRRMTDIISAY